MLKVQNINPLKRKITGDYCPKKKTKDSCIIDEKKICKLIVLTEEEREKHIWIEDGTNNTFKDNDWAKVIRFLYDLELQPQYRICKYFHYSPISNCFVGVDWMDNVIRGYITICRDQFGKKVKKEYLSSKRFVCLINDEYLLAKKAMYINNGTLHRNQRSILIALQDFYKEYNFEGRVSKI